MDREEKDKKIKEFFASPSAHQFHQKAVVPTRSVPAVEPEVQPIEEPVQAAETVEPALDVMVGNGAEEQEIPKKKSFSARKAVIAGVILLLISGLAGSTIYFFQKYRALTVKMSPNDEPKQITERIRQFMDLPSEEPTLATVTDRDRLKETAFFTGAQNGDKVLIYKQSRKVILYRPSTQRVVDIAALTPENDAPSVADTASGSTDIETKIAGEADEKVTLGSSANTADQQNEQEGEQPAKEEGDTDATEEQVEEAGADTTRIYIYNGTPTVGFSYKIERALGKIEKIEVVDRDDAAEKDYTQSLVVDLTGGNTAVAQEIAAALQGKVGPLPKGETAPEADILIIAGKPE